MAVGDQAEAGVRTYVAVGRETTFGTYASATTAVEALSCSFMTSIKSMKLDTLGNRGYAKRVQTDKMVGGTLEDYVSPDQSVLLFAGAMGGGITSALHTTGVYNHSLSAGNFASAGTGASLSFNVRKGSTLTWRYSGGRVNTMKLSAAVGEPLKATYEMVFVDSTLPSDDISGILSVSALLPFVYHQGVFRYQASEAAVQTTTANEPIQAFELTVNNNIISDAAARALGSLLPQVLPATRREVGFKITQRFDTSTAYNRMLQGTAGAVMLFFQSSQIGATGFYNELTCLMPKVFYNGGDVEVKDTGSILQAEIEMDVMVDSPATSTGRDIGFTFRNAVVSY